MKILFFIHEKLNSFVSRAKWNHSNKLLYVLSTEEGCLINREELEGVIEECSHQNSHHLSVLREVLERRDWIVERSGSLAKALKTPLTALCARSADNNHTTECFL